MEVHETVKKAAIEESNAAKTSLLKLLVSQKKIDIDKTRMQRAKHAYVDSSSLELGKTKTTHTSV